MSWITEAFNSVVRYHQENGFTGVVYTSESALNEADRIVPIRYIYNVKDDAEKPNFESLQIGDLGILNMNVLFSMIESLEQDSQNLFELLSQDIPEGKSVKVKLAQFLVGNKEPTDDEIVYYFHMLWALKFDE